MKVALVSPYSWTWPGGVNEHIRNLYLRMRERGHQVKVLAPQEHTALPDGFDPLDFISLGGSLSVPANRSRAHIAFSPTAYRKIRSSFKKEDFDLVHLHEPLIPSASLLALMVAPVPVVATFHAFREEGSRGYALAAPLLRRFATRIKVAIAVSEAALQFISRYFPGEYRVIPNGYDNHLFRPSESPPWEMEGASLLFVGREEPRKGLPVLLRAFSRVVEKYPEVKLGLAGIEKVPADLLSGLPERVKERIEVLGRLGGEALAEVYRKSWLLVAPSLGGESFGIVLVEAMASGTPVLASDIPGYRAVLRGCGCLVRPGEVNDLATAILELLTGQELLERMREQGLRRAAEFSWDVVVGRIEEVYREVMANQKVVTKREGSDGQGID